MTEEEVGQGEKKEQQARRVVHQRRARLAAQPDQHPHLRGAFGDDVDGWDGKIIVVFPTMVDFRGKMVPALRVRIPPPKQALRERPGRHRRQPKPAPTTQASDDFVDEAEPSRR